LKCLLSELKLKKIAAQSRLSLDVRMGGEGFKGVAGSLPKSVGVARGA
jgi:hypothetical protein